MEGETVIQVVGSLVALVAVAGAFLNPQALTSTINFFLNCSTQCMYSVISVLLLVITGAAFSYMFIKK